MGRSVSSIRHRPTLCTDKPASVTTSATGILGSRHSPPGRELNHNKLIHWEIRAFRALTRLYPRSFRAAYEREVIDFFVQERGQKVHGPALLRAMRWMSFSSEIHSSLSGGSALTSHLPPKSGAAKPSPGGH